MFEQICEAANVPPQTYAEQAMAEIVNEMIFSDTQYTDSEIKVEAVKRFNRKYR
jgi:hypothetical protein